MPQRVCEVQLQKKADDSAGFSRVSIGGPIAHPTEDIDGYYCVYRGSLDAAIVAVEAALVAMKVFKYNYPGQEPDVAPDDGKEFA